MLRIALAQVNATVGDLDGNAELIVEWTRRAAARGARVVVFPEMMLTGYPVEDLALRASFVEASIAALHKVAARLADEGLGGIAVVTGYLDRRTDLAPRTGVPAGAPLDAAACCTAGAWSSPRPSTTCRTTGCSTSSATSCPATRCRYSGWRPSPARASRSRSRSARTCGRTAARWRSACAPARGCSWCRTPRPTSAARTTCGSTWWCGGRARPMPPWPTPTWSAGRTS